MADSADLSVARKAPRKVSATRTRIDDLRVTRALLQRAGELKPITEEEARELDTFGRELDESTRASALASASLEFLAATLETATQVGQILDERPRVLAATSSLPGTSTRSS